MRADTHHWIITVDGQMAYARGQTLYGREELATLDGTRAEALEALWRHVLDYQPRRPWSWRQRWFYEDADGYLGCYRGRSGVEYLYSFRLGRLVQPPRNDQGPQDARPPAGRP